MAFKKGQGGRPRGVPNKATASVKAGIRLCYEGIGGDAAFQAWAKENPGEFYTKILTKIVPSELEHSGSDGEPINIHHHYAPESAGR